ncbi:phenazine biosynthesis protein PhzF [Devosia pacifica]|uniref:Phenazine biosynthesis protein PhzF n=1 Tax=Devosia pacifica TaxID=1335967 RepID=A0A918S062_9HYPH|nr:PhzF family phenazine biosynthesis protein [Devosia pacifica]GHA15590.1 phenazine biosynthesis protein PhzF [Devosia pacifica]
MLRYQLLDVFTSQPLAGNPLAVVHDAQRLSSQSMQAIAREFNLSETVFVLPPASSSNTARLRIFTPMVELPFAGHPTVGAAVALGLARKMSAMRLEEEVGLVTTLFERVGPRQGEARFTLPKLPEPAGPAPARRDIAMVLGLDPEEIGCGSYAPEVYSAGNPFYLIPVRGPDALAKASPVFGARWPELFPVGRHSVYVFTETPGEDGNELAARMFSPGMGLKEDPGTGSAAAALIGALAERYGDSGQAELTLRQGDEMGRPCRIRLYFRLEEGRLIHAGIGGDAVLVGEGQLDID